MTSTRNKQVIFAISDAGYATMALTMFDSVRPFYLDSDFYVFIVGKGRIATLNDDIKVVYIAEIMDSLDLSQRLVHYLQVELVTSIRPHCFQYLFAQDYERAIYLDPDIFLFRRMSEVDDLLDGNCNGVVTAHALRSVSDGQLEGGDSIFLKCGIFNIGFLALKQTGETIRMLAWWKDKLKWKCTVDWQNGYFVDQKWLEFLPVYFEGFHILRLPTYNVAPWNAEHYDLLRAGDKFFIGDLRTPVAFIHFSGIHRTIRFSGIRRMELHFKFMTEARSFYLKALQKRRFQRLPFVAYETRFERDGLLFDKVCSFLYKDYVKNTKDEKSNPLVEPFFYDYIHGVDQETGFSVYIRKLYEILPDIFVGYLSTKLATNWDNMIWLVKNHFSHDGVVSLETMISLRNNILRSPFVTLKRETHDAINQPYAKAVQTFSRQARRDSSTGKADQTVTFGADRIEIASGQVRVCIPYLDAFGNLPARNHLRAEQYTEIWVPSVACKESMAAQHGFSNLTPILQPAANQEFNGDDASLPPLKFIVLLRHDCQTSTCEQGSFTSIRAFEEAFESCSEALLVCFLANATSSSDRHKFAPFTNSNILVVEGDDKDYYGYLHRANCFISLHQNTPVAAAIAEAMALGKDVIATTHGAASHYLDSENSFPINPAPAIEVIRQAALALRTLYNEAGVTVSKGRKAQLFVQKHLCAQAVGFTMQKRIEELRALNDIAANSDRNSFRRRISHKLQRLKSRLHPAKVSAVAASDAANPAQEQIEAVIKILLRRAIRPDLLE